MAHRAHGSPQNGPKIHNVDLNRSSYVSLLLNAVERSPDVMNILRYFKELTHADGQNCLHPDLEIQRLVSRCIECWTEVQQILT